MKWGMIMTAILFSVNVVAQPYRLVCDEASLPELYTQIQVYAEEWKDGSFKKLPPVRYRLASNEALIDKDNILFNRALLYKQGGDLHIDLLFRGQIIPLTVSLPILKDIRYNLFTDSIKPVLNYYVNVEGIFSNGKIYPLDTSFVSIAASEGRMHGFEWILPAERDFDKVTFTATCRYHPYIKKTVTLYMKKNKDPRDAEGYGDKK